MKRFLIAIALVSSVVLGVKAQEDSEVTNSNGVEYQKGDKFFNIGISPFTYAYGSAYYSYTNYSSGMTMPAVIANFQMAFSEYITAGVTVGRYGRYYKWESPIYGSSYIDKYRFDYNYTILGFVGEFHYTSILKEIGIYDDISEKLDLYLGVILGTQQYKWKEKTQEYIYNYNTLQYEVRNVVNESSSSKGVFRGYGGGRYYFNPKLAVYAEFGYSGFGYLTLGLTVRM